MSLLMRQLALAENKFLTRYPHCWLVWEPGPSAVPAGGVDVSTIRTRVGGAAGTDRPLGDDALCFALKAADGSALKLGRAADNEVVIPDVTVSRLHARLALAGGQWRLTNLSETRRSAVDGKDVARETSQELRSGQVLELGEVKVTFYDAAAFKHRVASAG